MNQKNLKSHKPSKDTPPSRFISTLVRIYKFFASVRLAVPVILSLMIVFAVGTIIESLHGTEAATITVYQSPWFSLLLFFLAFNVTASALERWPWKKKHIGFVMTHAGILVVLAGSFITKTYMVDAQMAVQEGDVESRISFPETMLYAFPERGSSWSVPLPKKAFPWEGQIELASGESGFPFKTTLLHYYPKGRLREEIRPAENGPAAIQVTLFNTMMTQTQWLVENDPEKGVLQMGPAKLKFGGELLTEESPELLGPYLEFIFAGKTISLPIKKGMTLPAEFPLKDTPYTVTLLGVYRHAAILDGKLVERETPEETAGKDDSFAGTNPAVILKLEGNGISETHTAFAHFPDFPTMHGLKPSESGAKIVLKTPGQNPADSGNELRFIHTDEGLKAQIKTGKNIRTIPANPEEETATGWMDLKFKIEKFYPHSESYRVFTPEPNRSERVDAYRSAEILAEQNGISRQFWVAQGLPAQVNFGGKTYHFILGEEKAQVGFKIKLRDFRIEHYPGTNRPASFESDVTLIDDFRGIKKDTTISMNEPLDHNGFRIFQASYIQQEGSPDISVFSVVRDPGIPVKYAGTIIMISGITLMFVTGRLSFRKNDKNKTVSQRTSP